MNYYQNLEYSKFTGSSDENIEEVNHENLFPSFLSFKEMKSFGLQDYQENNQLDELSISEDLSETNISELGDYKDEFTDKMEEILDIDKINLLFNEAKEEDIRNQFNGEDEFDEINTILSLINNNVDTICYFTDKQLNTESASIKKERINIEKTQQNTRNEIIYKGINKEELELLLKDSNLHTFLQRMKLLDPILKDNRLFSNLLFFSILIGNVEFTKFYIEELIGKGENTEDILLNRFKLRENSQFITTFLKRKKEFENNNCSVIDYENLIYNNQSELEVICINWLLLKYKEENNLV